MILCRILRVRFWPKADSREIYNCLSYDSTVRIIILSIFHRDCVLKGELKLQNNKIKYRENYE